MARHRYKDDRDSIWDIAASLIGLYFLWLVFLYITDRTAYWRQFWYFVVFLVVVIAGSFAWKEFRYRRKQKKLDNLINSIKQNGLEDDVKNFINRFGMHKGKDDWKYLDHSFDWEQLKIFRKVLNEKGTQLSLDKWDDVLSLLRNYIHDTGEKVIRDSISLNPKKFTDLSGPEFENLLYRLFEAMGYTVQPTGKTGDQGGDLIANLNGQRLVIQAKCYSGTVGNKAVQEAIAAKRIYDCNRIVVATNSSFTKEAFELARVWNVELVSGEKLSEWLLQYLKESWG
ncbi:MAG: restriction endonuclease [Candidatus Wolfebacteria bacterium]|nr:restriction endonuclease [Candidatus Wolfebacteria bacterium]